MSQSSAPSAPGSPALPGPSVAALAQHLGLPPSPVPLSPAQLQRLSANKAAAHRNQSRRHRRAAAKASTVAASLGSGEEREVELAKAAADVEAFRSTPSVTVSPVGAPHYGTRQATGVITGKNPLICSEAEMSARDVKLETDIASNGEDARSMQLDEGACQIIELLERQQVSLHDDPRIQAALVYVAIRAGDVAAGMHDKYPKMEYYEAMIRERCERLGEVRSSRIPLGSLPGGYTSGSLARVVAQMFYVDSIRAVVRHLAGAHRTTHVTAEHHLRELLIEEVPYLKADTPGKRWHAALFTLGRHLSEREVDERFADPTARRRAMEVMLPIIIWRYVQGRRGVGLSYVLELQAAADAESDARAARAPRPVGGGEKADPARTKGDGDPEAERKCALEAKAARYERRMERIVAEMRSLASGDDTRRPRKGGAHRDTASSAAYESDEYEPSEWEEYSKNSSARYGGSFLVRDGVGETPVSSQSGDKDSSSESTDSSAEEDGRSATSEEVSGLTLPMELPPPTKTVKGRSSGKGKQPAHPSYSIPSALARFFRDPRPQMRWEQQWPLELNPKLMSVWTRAIDFF